MQIDITILYKEYYPKLLYYAGKFLPYDKQKAEDVVDEVFLKLLKVGVGNIDGYNNWLYACVRNKCMDELKENKRIIYDEYYIDAQELPYDDKEIKSEIIYRLHDYIEKLPPRIKQVFELQYFEGKTKEEIMEITGLSYHTVNVSIGTALKKLRMSFGIKYETLQDKIRRLHSKGYSNNTIRYMLRANRKIMSMALANTKTLKTS